MTNHHNSEELAPAYAAALRAELISTVASGRTRSVSVKAKAVGVGAVAFAVLGSGAVFAYSQISDGPVTDHSQARCYSSAAYASSDDFPGTSVAAVGSATAAGRVDLAVDACSAVWRAGILRQGIDGVVKSGNADDTSYPVRSCSRA